MKVAFDERISLCLLTEIPGQAGDDLCAGDDDAIFPMKHIYTID